MSLNIKSYYRWNEIYELIQMLEGEFLDHIQVFEFIKPHLQLVVHPTAKIQTAIQLGHEYFFYYGTLFLNEFEAPYLMSLSPGDLTNIFYERLDSFDEPIKIGTPKSLSKQLATSFFGKICNFGENEISRRSNGDEPDSAFHHEFSEFSRTFENKKTTPLFEENSSLFEETDGVFYSQVLLNSVSRNDLAIPAETYALFRNGLTSSAVIENRPAVHTNMRESDRDHLLRTIGGLAIAISKSRGGKFKSGNKPNKTQICNEINDVLREIPGLVTASGFAEGQRPSAVSQRIKEGLELLEADGMDFDR